MGEALQIKQQVRQWMDTARQMMLDGLNEGIDVATKTGPHDLVTNIDRQVEQYYITQIKQAYPEAHFFGEESIHNYTQEGMMWIIDPVDGTMNFVKQQDNFASMVAVYQDGNPVVGFILDVVNNDLYWGGPEVGAYRNEQPLLPPADLSLEQGLLGVGSRMILSNNYHSQELGQKAFGIRVNGSAGMEFISVLTGKTTGYLSYLHPWDFAAGRIIAESLGLTVKKIDGSALDMLSSTTVLVATKRTAAEVIRVANS